MELLLNTNRVILITGGAGLLGPQHALALNELGFNIILIDIDKKKLLLTYNKLKKKS